MLTRGRAKALGIKIDDLLENLKLTQIFTENNQTTDHFDENKNTSNQITENSENTTENSEKAENSENENSVNESVHSKTSEMSFGKITVGKPTELSDSHESSISKPGTSGLEEIEKQMGLLQLCGDSSQGEHGSKDPKEHSFNKDHSFVNWHPTPPKPSQRRDGLPPPSPFGGKSSEDGERRY